MDLFTPDRRAVLAGAGISLLAGPALARAAALGRAAGLVKITAIETFDILMPPGPRPYVPTYRGMTGGRSNVVRITTDAGVAGHSFLGTGADEAPAAAPVLTGQDLFAVEAHLKKGLLGWPSVEEAMWDAIGKIAGEPLCRLMGGARLQTVPVYVTYVWGGKEDDVPAMAQADQARIVQQAGLTAIKIQIMRKDYRDDVAAVAQMLAATGGGFRVMVDRTAGAVGLWSYDQALAAARGLADVGCYWLEEPLARDDYDGPARLRQAVPNLIITGGEAWRGLTPFRKGLEHGTYGIMQPEMRVCAGPLTLRKIGALCEAFDIPIAPHAATGLALAGRLQVSAAMGSVYQEVGTIQAGNLPWQVWEPYRPILHGQSAFTFRDGEIVVPQYPGLGLNLDEKALMKYRVAGFEKRGINPQAHN